MRKGDGAADYIIKETALFCRLFKNRISGSESEEGAARLIWLAEGEAGKDFLAGEVYSGKKPMKLKFKDENGEAADILWNSCTLMTDKYV